jgi:AcrR family transcriptional regulator
MLLRTFILIPSSASRGYSQNRALFRGLLFPADKGCEAPIRPRLPSPGGLAGRSRRSLDEIARRAGVGNATLYRHFPTRRHLFVAVCVEEVETLCALGDKLRSRRRPGDALMVWLRAYVEHVMAKHGLAAALVNGPGDDSAVIAACHAAIEATGGALLERAQQAGVVRSDLTFADLLQLVNAIVIAAESGGMGQADRLLRLIRDGVITSSR